jgi:hypothetical protein
MQRDDLKEALTDNLSPLRDCWSINLQAEADVVRRAVQVNLQAHIGKLEASKRGGRSRLSESDHVQNYRRVVAVNFNLVSGKDPAGLTQKTLTERRAWLDVEAWGRARVSASTSQRYLNSAIDQIEQQILAGYKPVTDVPETGVAPADDSVDLSGTPAEAPAVEATAKVSAGRSNSWLRRHAKWLAPTAAVVVAAAVSVPVVIERSGADAAPRVSSNGQPIPVAMAAGPVHVDSVVYVRDGSNKALGFSYVFPRKVQLSATDLAGLNQLSGNDPSYDEWMLSRGGVNPDDAPIQLALRNKTSNPISITNIELVKQCVAPLDGTLFYAPPQGEQGDIHLAFNLDDKFPIAKNHQTGASYFAGSNARTIQLLPNETSVLLLDATTKQYYCRFHLNLIVDPEDGGSPVSELVDNNGKPFAVTAVPKKDQFGDVRFAYYQAVYAFYQNITSRGLGYGPVNPVTYNGS